MNDLDKLYSFVFKGLLAEQSLDNTARVVPTVVADIDHALEEKLSLTTLAERHIATAKRMAVVYIAVATFENMARDLVQRVLAEAHDVDWWTNQVSEKIRTRAETRKSEEEKFKWHTPRGKDPIHYTDFGDLASIIRQNWGDFEPHIPSVEWVDSLFDVVERSRNVIMHSGQLADRDVERVGINIRDWVAQVGA